MNDKAIETARAAMAAYGRLASFEAVQRITAGPISAVVRVRFRKPDRIAVDYESYKDPLMEFEEGFTGGPEYSPDELVGMQIFYDGSGTWLYEARRELATHKPGRAVFGPLPRTNVLAEIGFLRDLVRDFLLRDEGEESIGGRAALRIGLKPKAPHRSLLLKEEVFPIDRGTVALDKETLFPLRVTFHPNRLSPVAYLIGPSTPVVVEYSEVCLDRADEAAFSFAPPAGVRVFREEAVPVGELAERLPFPFRVEALAQAGPYRPFGSHALVTKSDSDGRAFAQMAFVRTEEEEKDEQLSGSLSLRVGNYLSHNMSRRHAFLSEHGEAVALGALAARLVDRSALWSDELPEAASRSILEVGWEDNGVHWFLLGEDLDKETLVGVARALAETHRPTAR